MKKIKFLLLLLAGITVLPLTAQNDIISAADFMKLMKSDKNLILVDASKPDIYNRTHIKNAINVPYKILNKEGEIFGLLKNPADVAAILGKKGISEKKTIVVYDEGSQKYSSRVYWVLKYLGAPNVKILHKDLTAFRKARVPLTGMKPSVKPATFTPHVDKSVYAGINDVNNAKAKIIDARSVDEFKGLGDYSEGHIPGSVNIPFNEVQTENGAFKSKEEILNILDSKGISPADPIIVYCKTGVKAAVLYVALKNITEAENVKLYDGAYVEWASYDKPLEQ